MDYQRLNPYQPPTAVEVLPFDQDEYMVVRTTKLTYKELWNISANLFEFVVGSIVKTLHIPLPTLLAFGWNIHRLPAEQVSEIADNRIKPWADEAMECQMPFVFYYTLPCVGCAEAIVAIFATKERQILMSVSNVRFWGGPKKLEKTRVSLVSRMQDGKILTTSESKPSLNFPPHILLQRMLNQRLDALLAMQRQRIADYPSPAVPWRDAEEIEQYLRTHEKQISEFYVERGLYVLATPQKITQLRDQASRIAPPTVASSGRSFSGTIFFWMIFFGLIYDWLVPAKNLQQALFQMLLPLIGLLG